MAKRLTQREMNEREEVTGALFAALTRFYEVHGATADQASFMADHVWSTIESEFEREEIEGY